MLRHSAAQLFNEDDIAFRLCALAGELDFPWRKA
jgi:hypothetical protein